MKERPILFSTEMVRAILAERKTQTRRVVTPQPDELHYSGMVDDRQFARFWSPGEYKHTATITDVRCPYGKPGDMLWVRETWRYWGSIEAPTKAHIAYKADGDLAGRWKPSIHMPRWASRINLQILAVRVERVQEIGELDAEREGVSDDPLVPTHFPYYDDTPGSTRSPVESFRTLWDSINAKRGYEWDGNPWVWVVEFRRVA